MLLTARLTTTLRAAVGGPTFARAVAAASFSRVRGYYGSRATPYAVGLGLEQVSVPSAIPVLEVGKSDAPAVLLLQEWWGVTEEIKKQASHLSESTGFRCIIPDLYKGKIGVDAEEASHLMGNLDFKSAIQEITQVAKWAKETSPSVAVCGFCMGGALSLCAAQHSPDVCAAVSFYGIPDRAVCQPEEITIPLQLHFGELDNMKGFSDPERARALAQQLSDAGVEYELFQYVGVGHAFMNSAADNPEITPGKHASTGFPPSNPDQRALAWSRVIHFLKLAFSDAPAAAKARPLS